MCGRYTIIAPFVQIIRRFNTSKHPEEQSYKPNYNVAPGTQILAVVNDGTVNRLGYLKWGLIPAWATDPKIGYKMINARAESITTKPSFKSAFKRHRCLIIADSFYEWTHDDPKNKHPFRFKMNNDDLFAMAGLWESWKSPDGQVIHSATIITTEANEIMAPIHNRMPVILTKEDEQRWIDPSIQDSEQLSFLLKPYDADKMDTYEVSKDVNSPRNNDPHLIDKV